jgi:hypothetical protein
MSRGLSLGHGGNGPLAVTDEVLETGLERLAAALD